MRATKRHLAMIVSISLLPAFAEAGGLEARLRGGLSVASMQGEVAARPYGSDKLGLTLGAELILPMATLVSLEPGLAYSMRGYSEGEFVGTEGFRIGSYEYLVAVDYLVGSLAARTKLPALGRIEPSLLAGPTAAYPVRERIVLTGDVRSQPPGKALDGWDYGLLLGVAAASKAGRGALSVEARWSIGLTSLYWQNPAADSSADPDDYRSRVLEITTAYTFPILR